MAFVINTNLDANQAQQALNQNQFSLSRTFERLASGTRINGASDDAAGLSISTRMEAQVRGVSKAIGNANDAISLSQTTDGALDEVTNVLQRIRELAVQAASDLNSVEDRQKIQTEIDELVKEVDRIGQGEFNGKALFGGRFDFQLGSNVDQESGVTLTTRKLASNRLGSFSRDTTGNVDTSLTLNSNDLTIIKSDGTSVAVRPTIADDDTVSTMYQSGSAIAKAAAINSGTAYHGVTAQVNATIYTAPNPISDATLDHANYLEINGEKIKGLTVLAKDADGTLTDAINAVSEKTGVVASVNNDGHLHLVAEDGRNIAIAALGLEASKLGTGLDYNRQDPSEIKGGTLTLESRDAYTLRGAGGLDALGGVGSPIPPSNIANIVTGEMTVKTFTAGSGTSWDAIEDVISITGNVSQGQNQIRADDYFYIRFFMLNVGLKAQLFVDDSGASTVVLQGQPEAQAFANGNRFELNNLHGLVSLAVEIDNLENLDTDRQGSSPVTAFRFQLTAQGDINYPVEAVMGKNLEETALSSIDVLSTESAELVLKTVDQALEEVSAARAKLGAMNNRLESTINNLDQTKHNLAGAKSQIMDADFAAETAQLSKSQIIQRAGASVLAQANSSQQTVLGLL